MPVSADDGTAAETAEPAGAHVPPHRGHVQGGEVPQPVVRVQPGHLYRPVAEVTRALVGAVQVAVNEVGGHDRVHDPLETPAVRVVAGQVLGCPLGGRVGEGVGDAGRAVVADHHVGVTAAGDGHLLLGGDLLLRPPVHVLGP